MAFTAAGSTTGAVLIRDLYQSDFVDTCYFTNFLGLRMPDGRDLFVKKLWGGGSNYRWVVRQNTGNTSVEIFTEGQVQPTPNQQDYSAASVAFSYYRAMVQLTGHAVDAMGSSQIPIDAVSSELDGAAQDVSELMNTTFLGATNSGLEVAVDSTTTYAGIARGAATYWESVETSVGGALTITALEDMLETLLDNDVGARPQALLAPFNQLTNYARLTGTPYMQNGPPNDKGQQLVAPQFAGMPLLGVGNFSNTVIAMLDLGTTQRPKFRVPVIRPMQVKTMAPNGDSDVYQVSTGAAFICTDPMRQGKLVSVTA